MSRSNNEALEQLADLEYPYGFVTDIESETIAPGLDESVVRLISAKKREPEWLLAWRLKALRRFLELLEHERERNWAKIHYPRIDYQKIIYYSAASARVLLDIFFIYSRLSSCDIGYCKDSGNRRAHVGGWAPPSQARQAPRRRLDR